METQERPTGRHRIVYRVRDDQRMVTLIAALAAHATKVVEQGVDAVSPNQTDPDGQRRRVAVELSGAILSELFRMLAKALALAVQARVPFAGNGILHAASAALRAPLRPPAPVIDLTDAAARRKGPVRG